MRQRPQGMSGAQPISAPLLDRLIGGVPQTGRGDGGREAASVRALRQSIQRDLESLLNTRWRCKSWPPRMDELEQSVVNYGIPDFTGASFDNPMSQRDFRMIIMSAIKRFEPRLHNVKVSLMSGGAGGDETRTLRFRIEASVQGTEGWQNVAYETLMNPTDATFTVKGSGR